MCFNVLTLMSRTGDLYIGALGTMPNLFTPPRAEARPINYEESDVEMANLNSKVKSIQSQEPTQILAQWGDELNINVEISPHIEACYHHTLVTGKISNKYRLIIFRKSLFSPFYLNIQQFFFSKQQYCHVKFLSKLFDEMIFKSNCLKIIDFLCQSLPNLGSFD